MSLIRNERTKLLATGLNNLGVAIIVTGLVSPSVAVLYGTATAHPFNWLVIGGVWFFTGASLHLLAQVALGSLRS